MEEVNLLTNTTKIDQTNTRRKVSVTCFIFLVCACYIISQGIISDYSHSELFQFKGQVNRINIINQCVNCVESANETVNNESLTNVELKYAPTSNPFHRRVFLDIKDIKRTSTNIFFLETRCSTEKGLNEFLNNTGFILNARQCCSIESTALMNLDRPVYVFHSCPISDDFLTHSPKFVEKLFEYSNIYLVRLNTSEFFINTPLEELYEKKLLETSLHPIEHTSDLIRLLVLWWFGGTYSDIDVVTIRSFDALKSNWIGSQDANTINNGVMNFAPDGAGHNLLQKVLQHLNNHFDGSQWASNGQFLVTPFILNECQAKSVREAVKVCNGSFTVLSTDKLYPIYYPSWKVFFIGEKGKHVVDQVKSSAFSVHIWNYMSHQAKVQVNSTQAYALLASEFCPEVYQNCGDSF